jgi:acetyl esterase/lipase
MSAGGHLALVLATTGDDGDPNATDPLLKVSSRVATVAAIVPPTDLRVMVWESEDSLPGDRNFPALDLSKDAAAEYSPLIHVSADDATALVISGTQDVLVPANDGKWIASAYEKHGVQTKLMLLEANHGLQGKQPEAFAAFSAWFVDQLAESSPTALR